MLCIQTAPASTARADAGVVCPWTVYRLCGDTRILERHYEAMARRVQYGERTGLGLIRPETGPGDRPSPGHKEDGTNLGPPPRGMGGTDCSARAASGKSN